MWKKHNSHYSLAQGTKLVTSQIVPPTLHVPPSHLPCLTSAQWGWSQARWPVFESSQSSGAGSRDMRLSPGASFYQGGGYRCTVALEVMLLCRRHGQHGSPRPPDYQPTASAVLQNINFQWGTRLHLGGTWFDLEREEVEIEMVAPTYWITRCHIPDKYGTVEKGFEIFCPEFRIKVHNHTPPPAPPPSSPPAPARLSLPDVCPFYGWTLLDITGADIQRWMTVLDDLGVNLLHLRGSCPSKLV